MEKGLTELTDQELLDRRKKAKSYNTINAVLLGVLVGIAIYSTVVNGLSFFTFIPIVFAIFAANQWKKSKDVLEKEINSRNLK